MKCILSHIFRIENGDDHVDIYGAANRKHNRGNWIEWIHLRAHEYEAAKWKKEKAAEQRKEPSCENSGQSANLVWDRELTALFLSCSVWFNIWNRTEWIVDGWVKLLSFLIKIVAISSENRRIRRANEKYSISMVKWARECRYYVNSSCISKRFAHYCNAVWRLSKQLIIGNISKSIRTSDVQLYMLSVKRAVDMFIFFTRKCNLFREKMYHLSQLKINFISNNKWFGMINIFHFHNNQIYIFCVYISIIIVCLFVVFKSVFCFYNEFDFGKSIS